MTDTEDAPDFEIRSELLKGFQIRSGIEELSEDALDHALTHRSYSRENGPK